MIYHLKLDFALLSVTDCHVVGLLAMGMFNENERDRFTARGAFHFKFSR
jgi:hypothetical protein